MTAAIRGIHAGSDVRLLGKSADRTGTVESPDAQRPRSATGRARRYRIPVEPRNGLPLPARYEWRKGGRISLLTYRIMAEIGPERGSL